MRRAAGLLSRPSGSELPETFWYSVKRRLLGPPMVNEQLREQRLSKSLALGVLSPDGISSSAYGTEEILHRAAAALRPRRVHAAPADDRGDPVRACSWWCCPTARSSSVYTRAGGSYVVARENFGPAGRPGRRGGAADRLRGHGRGADRRRARAAVASAFPALGAATRREIIRSASSCCMCYGNLRGIREAGKIFALPTYLFSGSVGLMIVVGLVRELLRRPAAEPPAHRPGPYTIGARHRTGCSPSAIIFTLLRAFANGGSSLTGIEAVSNAVSAFRPPEGRNARRVLVTEGVHPGLPGRRDLLAGPRHPRGPLRQRRPDRDRPGGQPGLRPRRAGQASVLRGAGGDRADPVHRRQHQLQRLPVPDQLRRRGLVPAPLADQARPPAGLLQRDHRADRAVALDPAGRRRRQRQRPGPVLRDRRVHRRSPWPGSAWPGTTARTREPGWRAQAGHQLLGRRLHRARGGDLRGREVHRGRLAGGDRLPGRWCSRSSG